MTFVCILLYIALLVEVNSRFSTGLKLLTIDSKASRQRVDASLARKMSKLPYSVGAVWVGVGT